MMPPKKPKPVPKDDPKPFVRCGDCDAILDPGTKVCPNCGYDI
jgi:hypothetical protein